MESSRAENISSGRDGYPLLQDQEHSYGEIQIHAASPVYKSPSHLKIKGSQGRFNEAAAPEDNHTEGTALSGRILTNLNANSVLMKDAAMRGERRANQV